MTCKCTIERLQGWSAWWTAKTDRIFDAKSAAVARPTPTSASSAPTTAPAKKKVFPTAYSRQSKQANATKPAPVIVNDENRRENMKASSGTDVSDDGTTTPPLSPTTRQLTQTIARRTSNNANNSMRTPPSSPLGFRLPSPVAKKGSAERSVARSKSSLDFTVDQLAHTDTADLKLSASKEISAFDFSPQVGKDSKKRKLSESREDDKTAQKDSQTRASKVAKYSKDQSPSESPRSASSMDSPMKLDLSMDSPTSPLSPRRSPRTRKTSAHDPSPFDFPNDHPPVARRLPLSPGKPVAPSGANNAKRNNVKLDLVTEPVHTKVDLTADGTTPPVAGGFKPVLPSSPPRAGKVYSRRK